MKKLFLDLTFAALCAALLSACGGDSGSKADTSDEIVAESMDDLPNCTKNREGVRAITDEGNYVCTDGAWEEEAPEIPSFETEEDLHNCSRKKEGMVVYVEDLEDTLVCKSGEWQSASDVEEDDGQDDEDGESSSSDRPAYDISVETEDELPECTAKREGTVVYVEESDLLAVCESGLWQVMDTDEGTSSDSSEDVESSGSSEGSSASVPGGSSDASTYDVVTGTLTDSRDGQTYRTVKIGDQVWMAENLNYAYTAVPFDNGDYISDSTSWCHGDDPANCAKYGRLYTWAAAMDSVGEWSTSGKGCGYGENCSVASAGSATLVRGICPKGWHLPSHDEWEALIVAVDGSITEYTSSNTAGTKLKSQTGWKINGNGTDAFGFSALPAGIRSDFEAYYEEGYDAYFWSSTESEYDSGKAYYMVLCYDVGDAGLDNYYKDFGYSVRCLKDESVELVSSSSVESSSSEGGEELTGPTGDLYSCLQDSDIMGTKTKICTETTANSATATELKATCTSFDYEGMKMTSTEGTGCSAETGYVKKCVVSNDAAVYFFDADAADKSCDELIKKD